MLTIQKQTSFTNLDDPEFFLLKHSIYRQSRFLLQQQQKPEEQQRKKQ